MPTNEIKLQEDEVTKITDIRRTYFNIQTAVGQLTLTKLNLNNQLSRINEQEAGVLDEYAKTQDVERTLVEGLQKKYGIGTLNIESGTFVPAPAQEAADAETPKASATK